MTNREKLSNEYGLLFGISKNIPIRFNYGGVDYHGLAELCEISRKTEVFDKKEVTTAVFQKDCLQITVVSTLYPSYGAFDYAVYFTNCGEENSAVLSGVLACDMEVSGANPKLKGIMGDYDYRYEPYEQDLSIEPVNFTSTRGRPSHTHFPYFNLESDCGGRMIAVGWAGTWQADFVYDAETEKTRFSALGTVGFNAYLKPGETVRTPLIAMLLYEDCLKATNLWRKWMIECNMPKENGNSDTVIQPHTLFMLAFDTGKPNSDGCISEDYTTWKKSLDALYSHGVDVDVVHYDAGWYSDPNGETVPTDWWGTVGSWEMDAVKWPSGTFDERLAYQRAHGSKMMMWFEPERVSYLDGLAKNYGYDKKWAISRPGDNGIINNIGVPECRKWTLGRITRAMTKYGVDLYREDFNIDPAPFWLENDKALGENRNGITENLYVQGHYALWDELIDFCANNNKCAFLDSCASGGGRNDLESMRRAVPLLRSDADRSTTALRLSFNTRFNKWIPYGGAHAKDTAGEMSQGKNVDLYAMRASYNLDIFFKLPWSLNKELSWNVILQGIKEWKSVTPYFYCDFYPLTPDHSITDDSGWTAYEYFDPSSDSGIVQAFRQPDCDLPSLTVNLSGVDENGYYAVKDADGLLDIDRISGAELIKGLTLSATTPRTSILLFLSPCKA